MVEEKKDIAAFTNYKDESGADAPIKSQEKKPEIKVEATTQKQQITQTQTAKPAPSGINKQKDKNSELKYKKILILF